MPTKIKKIFRLFNSLASIEEASLIVFAFIAVVFSIVFILVVATNPSFHIFSSKFIDTSLASDFGSFIGGTINPILSITSIILLIMSIRNQKKETRKNDIKTHIYELLKYNRDTVSELEYKPSNEEKQRVQTGSKFFIYAKRQIEEAAEAVKEQLPSLQQIQRYQLAYLVFYFGTSLETKGTLKKHLNKIISDSDAEKLINKIREKHAKYNKEIQYYGGHQNRLGCYFRQLYQLIHTVDTEIILDETEKQRFIRTIRAQLSDYEQALLFYSSLTLESAWAREDTQIKPLITRYELIKNIQDGFLKFENFKTIYPDISYE